jgi:formate/nitrite transporter FocA (FNT family)
MKGGKLMPNKIQIFLSILSIFAGIFIFGIGADMAFKISKDPSGATIFTFIAIAAALFFGLLIIIRNLKELSTSKS